MIVYGTKRGAFGKLLLRRWYKKRVSDKNKRKCDIKFRRIWWWSATRWNQRHGENSNTVQTNM